jgi:hypothetical protein
MILHDHKKIESECKAIMRRCFPLKDVGDDDVKYLVEGESLVIRQVLNAQVKYDDLEQ